MAFFIIIQFNSIKINTVILDMDIQSKSVQGFVNIAEKNAPDINDLFQLANDLLEKDTERRTIHKFLNLGHLPSVNSTIAENNLVEDWLELLIKLIVKSIMAPRRQFGVKIPTRISP